MTTLSRLYQISVIVVAAFALLLSSTGMVEAWTWSEYVKCPIDFSKALSHTRSATRGAGIDMDYCFAERSLYEDIAATGATDGIMAIHGYGGFEAPVEGMVKGYGDAGGCFSIDSDAALYEWFILSTEASDARSYVHLQLTDAEHDACQRVLRSMLRWRLRGAERCEIQNKTMVQGYPDPEPDETSTCCTRLMKARGCLDVWEMHMY